MTFPSFAGARFVVRTVGVSDYDSLQTQVPPPHTQGPAVPDQLHPERSHDQRRRLALGRRRRAASAHRTSSGWDLENDMGLSGFHTKHAFVFSGGYDLPGKGALLGGWSVNWVLSMPTAGRRRRSAARVATGVGRRLLRAARRRSVRGRHDVTSSTTRPPSPIRLRSRRSGRRTSARWAASAARSPARRCGSSTWASRSGSGSSGQSRLEFRAEAFNVTNTPAFNLPGSLNFHDARNFASISSMRNAPRQVQLGLKFYW